MFYYSEIYFLSIIKFQWNVILTSSHVKFTIQVVKVIYKAKTIMPVKAKLKKTDKQIEICNYRVTAL